MSDHEHLLSIASAIADGSGVAWADEVKRASTSGDTATLNALRDLEQLLSALREADRDEDPTATTIPPQPSIDRTAPQRWGHLSILDTIGKGSFGTVYRAHDARLGVDVALKLLAPSRSGRPAERILREARLLARVRHPNVVRVFGVDDTAEPMGLWMELVEGNSLRDLVRMNGPFGAQEAAIVGRELCRAMAAVHQAGFLHGDIKAHNVIRESGGRIVLMDFGAGQAFDEESVESSGPLAGTPVYLAPEVLSGGPRTAASDIYALGVLLYHVVTRSYPVTGHSVPALLDAHQRGERRHLRDARPDLPEDFVRAVEEAIAADPRRRFASPGQFEDALSRVTSPTDATAAFRQRRRSSSRGQWAVGIAAAGVAGIVGFAAYVLPSGENARRTVATSEPPSVSPVPTADAGANGQYDIEAAFYRASRSGDERLVTDARIAPGDELFLKLQSSVPLHVYVVDEDEKGAAFLLFPLRGERLTNPLPAGQQVTLPGASRWQVTTAGEREHFLVFASPEPVDSLEKAFARLPTPRAGAPVGAPLTTATVEQLRGVGGITAAPTSQNAEAGLSRLFTLPLGDAPERARGLWVRQLTVANPGK
jgi:serine/threonine-protein kinase